MTSAIVRPLAIAAVPASHAGHCPLCARKTRPDRVPPGMRTANFDLCHACWCKTPEGRKYKREHRGEARSNPRKRTLERDIAHCSCCGRHLRSSRIYAGKRATGFDLCHQCWRKSPEGRASERAFKLARREPAEPKEPVCLKCIHYLNDQCGLGFPDRPSSPDDCAAYLTECLLP